MSSTIGDSASGVVGLLVNGLCRLPALQCASNAAAMSGELSIRLLAGLWTGTIGNPTPNSNLSKAVEYIRNNYRPYGSVDQKGEYTIGSKALTVLTLNMWLQSALLNEAAYHACGPIPRLYNDVLSLQGPIQLSDKSIYPRVAERINYYADKYANKAEL